MIELLVTVRCLNMTLCQIIFSSLKLNLMKQITPSHEDEENPEDIKDHLTWWTDDGDTCQNLKFQCASHIVFIINDHFKLYRSDQHNEILLKDVWCEILYFYFPSVPAVKTPQWWEMCSRFPLSDAAVWICVHAFTISSMKSAAVTSHFCSWSHKPSVQNSPSGSGQELIDLSDLSDPLLRIIYTTLQYIQLQCINWSLMQTAFMEFKQYELF